jgi:hypothetical protein
MHRNLWIKLAKIWGQVGGGQLAVGGRAPPVAGLAGATVAALNTYKKKFFKILKNELNKQVKLCKNVNSTNNGVNDEI